MYGYVIQMFSFECPALARGFPALGLPASWPQGRSKTPLLAAPEPLERSNPPHRSHRDAQNLCLSMLLRDRGAQTGCPACFFAPQRRSQRRSRWRSKKLFKEAVLCDTALCDTSLLLTPACLLDRSYVMLCDNTGCTKLKITNDNKYQRVSNAPGCRKKPILKNTNAGVDHTQ